MIGRERLRELQSIEEIDREITERQTMLNNLTQSLTPQIVSEEISELRNRRTQLEEALAERVARIVKLDKSTTKLWLMKYGWDAKETIRRLAAGGYINKHGVRVPNPCSETDMKGRDLDRVGRNIKPGQRWDDETIDAILADPDNT